VLHLHARYVNVCIYFTRAFLIFQFAFSSKSTQIFCAHFRFFTSPFLEQISNFILFSPKKAEKQQNTGQMN